MDAVSDLDVPDHWNCLCHVAVLPVSAAMILGSMDAISDLDVHFFDLWNGLCHVAVQPAYPC